MNLLLLEPADFIAADRVLLRGRRLKHMREVHRVEAGECLRVGLLGAQMGSGRVLRLDEQEAELAVAFDQPPPAKLPRLQRARPNDSPSPLNGERAGVRGGNARQSPTYEDLFAAVPRPWGFLCALDLFSPLTLTLSPLRGEGTGSGRAMTARLSFGFGREGFERSRIRAAVRRSRRCLRASRLIASATSPARLASRFQDGHEQIVGFQILGT